MAMSLEILNGKTAASLQQHGNKLPPYFDHIPVFEYVNTL